MSSGNIRSGCLTDNVAFSGAFIFNVERKIKRTDEN
tara:strand:+ start:1432 stop:1539 length:108 start_codon:yes stop_codon:yes gene_type:complete